jgi:hypothetical protein
MKSSLPLPAYERNQPNLATLPPVGPRGLCLEIRISGVVSQRQRGPLADVVGRLKKRARLYQGLAAMRPNQGGH